jgi:hypothetical protein
MSAEPPTPPELFARFERGEMDRDELHALLALHARELIAEMEDDYQHPAAALVEFLLARRALNRLLRRHSHGTLREVLVALSKIPDFPPARHLWNAGHPDVPLHCFFRMRREPVFRIRELRPHGDRGFSVSCEFGAAARGMATRQTISLVRDHGWNLRAGPPPEA